MRCLGLCVLKAGGESGLDWVSWHVCGANAENKSVSLTWCLSSNDILWRPHQLQTNKDVHKENRSHRGRCRGEMHLVSEEMCQVGVRQRPLLMSVHF